MNILFVGYVVGKSGREKLISSIKDLKIKYDIDFTIVNGENSAHGKGITKKIYNQFINEGIDCITLGNHSFSKEILLTYIDELDNLIRPINLSPVEYGNFYKVYNIKSLKVCVTNIMCNGFMNRVVQSPFESMDYILDSVDADIFIVDLHGESTAEKIAFAYNYSDRVHAVIGTHTHVQTADERIIGKLAFISDVGMTGPYESVIGRDIDEILSLLVHKEKTKFTVANGEAVLSAVVIHIDEKNLKSNDIERILIKPKNHN